MSGFQQNMNDRKRIFAALRFCRSLFTDLSAAMLIAIPLSENFVTLTSRAVIFIIMAYTAYSLEEITYDKY